jgi:hypothetical protein
MDGVSRRLSSPTFVGRAEELAVLDGALQRAATGVPAFAFIAGESGVGKSRLIAEFEGRAREAGAQVFVGHCLELGGTVIPYAPLLDALRPVARELALCGEELRDSLTPQTRLALAELMPEFGSKLDLAGGSGEERNGNQSRLFEGLLALLDRLGAQQPPIVLVLEDLHWADASTRDFLTFLVRSARTEPLCLVATYRSDELHRRHPLRPVLAELERATGPTPAWPSACSRGPRATRSTPRSCSPPRPTTPAPSCRSRCATRCSPGSSGCPWPPRPSCAWPRWPSGRSTTRCSRGSATTSAPTS